VISIELIVKPHARDLSATRATETQGSAPLSADTSPRSQTSTCAFRGGEVGAQHLDQVTGDRVAVERDHVAPNLSVLM
jgi:hypothetical protein